MRYNVLTQELYVFCFIDYESFVTEVHIIHLKQHLISIHFNVLQKIICGDYNKTLQNKFLSATA